MGWRRSHVGASAAPALVRELRPAWSEGPLSAPSLLYRRRSFRRAAPGEIRIENLQRIGAGHGSRVRRLREVHHLRICVAEGGPLRQPMPIGIAVFREVCPIACHRFRDLTILLGGLRIEMLKHVWNLRAMRRSVSRAWRIRTIFRVLVEVVIEDFGFPRFRLEP